MTKNKQVKRLICLISVLLTGPAMTVGAAGFSCAADRHDYEETAYEPPTETQNGSITYECRICGTGYREILFATGHEWSSWITAEEPTCTEPGISRRTCEVGATHDEMREIPATGHIYEETITEPACEEPGKRIYACTVCGDSYEEVSEEATGHLYTETVAEMAACEKEGIRMFTCEVCDDAYTEVIPAGSHNYGDWIIRQEAREGSEGSRYQECLLCGDRIRETIPALPVPEEQPEPEEDEPGPEKPFFGIVEIAVAGANIGLWILLFLLLSGEFAFLNWERRKKKEISEARRQEEEAEDDGYEFI